MCIVAGLKDQYAHEQGKARELSKKIERGKKEFDELEKDNEELELENNDLRAQLQKYSGIGGNIKKADAEIGEIGGVTGLPDDSDNLATLRNTIENMKAQAAATGNTAEVTELQGELDNMKEKLAQAETARDRWAALGRVSNPVFCDVDEIALRTIFISNPANIKIESDGAISRGPAGKREVPGQVRTSIR